MLPLVVSLGGSLIVPDQLDAAFLKAFRRLVLKHVDKGKKFILICGGGKLSRRYQRTADAITKLTRNDVDWLGIHATRLNAHLLRTLFRSHAQQRIIKNPTSPFTMRKPIVIAAGWKPGFSTDYDAVVLAERHNATTVINLTNTDYVYDKNPQTHPDARPLPKLSWKRYLAMVGTTWDPGLNLPFDPVAAKKAYAAKLTVHVVNGNNLRNVEHVIDGKPFTGTTLF